MSGVMVRHLLTLYSKQNCQQVPWSSNYVIEGKQSGNLKLQLIVPRLGDNSSRGPIVRPFDKFSVGMSSIAFL